MTDVRIRASAWLLVAAMTGAACNDTPVTPTTTVTPQTPINFSSRLTVGGFAWRSFTLNTAGDVTARLAVLSPDTGVVVGMGLGTFDGTNCTLTTSVETAVDETNPQISVTLSAGNYCVRIWDIGNLTKVNDFGVYVILP